MNCGLLASEIDSQSEPDTSLTATSGWPSRVKITGPSFTISASSATVKLAFSRGTTLIARSPRRLSEADGLPEQSLRAPACLLQWPLVREVRRKDHRPRAAILAPPARPRP